MPIHHPQAAEHTNLPQSFRDWTRGKAIASAAEEGIDMTEAHWEVIEFMRARYLDHGADCNARVMIRALQQQFKERGGKRYLYSLFPRGPVVQGSRIAGIPLPAHSLDLSFGSVH
ncbi:MAG: TusE/DsrC/DsvC family sulfur relay protein [Candidatus Sedimenticola endophacoides]